MKAKRSGNKAVMYEDQGGNFYHPKCLKDRIHFANIARHYRELEKTILVEAVYYGDKRKCICAYCGILIT